MADWVAITDSQVDPDAPLTSELAYAWRDNPIAIAEGAVGAPRIEDAALDSTVTSAGETWVAERMIARTHGGIGTSAIAKVGSGTSAYAFGATIAGSGLQVSDADGDPGSPTTTLTGTWRCLGRIHTSGVRATLWQRVA